MVKSVAELWVCPFLLVSFAVVAIARHLSARDPLQGAPRFSQPVPHVAHRTLLLALLLPVVASFRMCCLAGSICWWHCVGRTGSRTKNVCIRACVSHRMKSCVDGPGICC